MLLRCLEGPRSRNSTDDEGLLGSPRYRVRAWDLGPALRSSASLNLVYAITAKEMRKMRLLDSDSFVLEWDASQWPGWLSPQLITSLIFTYPSGEDQHTQWCASLERFVSSFIDERYEPFLSGVDAPAIPNRDGDRTDVQSIPPSEEDQADPDFVTPNFDPNSGGRRNSHPRPWSAIARKGPRSESSSLM
ncbi:hypothetical protein D9757_003116 [Collybiopsis confluens]|uniref:Uncharacterized protein n=1 Tax=Collybiopsis confluens TaxID=2823264 RepID=A0A8H5MEJ6_9AGAR|nr:hypothetical protein D9757_003116 [Collybiopsis confluens]